MTFEEQIKQLKEILVLKDEILHLKEELYKKEALIYQQHQLIIPYIPYSTPFLSSSATPSSVTYTIRGNYGSF